jgi:hypothetical protein
VRSRSRTPICRLTSPERFRAAGDLDAALAQLAEAARCYGAAGRWGHALRLWGAVAKGRVRQLAGRGPVIP